VYNSIKFEIPFHFLYLSSQRIWHSDPFKTNRNNQTMNTSALLNFLSSLERQGILPSVANKKIQDFLDYSVRSTGKLFLAFAATIGALFVSAGVFAIISHNWDDFPKHVRGILSFVPALVALYFYYLAVFKHPKSTSWIEASSLFLMLMIGATMALVSQTYQMDGDFDRFVIIWLCLTIPLFYIARASGIAIFYLILACKFLYPSWSFNLFGGSEFALNDRYYLFWVFLFAFLPHFYFALNKTSNQQGFRSIYLGWVLAIVFIVALPFSVKNGYLWWGTATIMGFYLLGKKFYAGNISSLGRPFQTITLFFLFQFLLMLSTDFFYDLIYRFDGLKDINIWTGELKFFYFTGLALVMALSFLTLYLMKKGMIFNKYVIFTPILIVFMYFVYSMNEFFDFDMEWFGFLVLNFYILGFGINAMIKGNKSKNILYMFYGLVIIAYLMWMRYFDMDIAFWLKGIFFMGVGGLFFLIHSLSADELEH